MGVQKRPTDRGVVDPEFQQPGSQPVCPRTGPSERSGVRGEAGVEAVRDALVERLTPGLQQFRDEHRRRVGGRIDVIGRTEQLIGRVVIDHQYLATGVGERTQRSEPVDAGDVDGHHEVAVVSHRIGIDQQMATRQGLQGFGKHRRGGKAHLYALSQPLENESKCEPGADGVGIGIDVADDADRVSTVEQLSGSSTVDAQR